MSEITFVCPSCGQHIVCGNELGGQDTACPTCEHTITVPAARAQQAECGCATRKRIAGLHRETWAFVVSCAILLVLLNAVPFHRERLEVDPEAGAVSFGHSVLTMAEMPRCGFPLPAVESIDVYFDNCFKLQRPDVASISVDTGAAKIELNWGTQKGVVSFVGLAEVEIDLRTRQSRFPGGGAVRLLWWTMIQDVVFAFITICGIAFIVERSLKRAEERNGFSKSE